MTLWSAQEWALAASLCRQSAAPAGGSRVTLESNLYSHLKVKRRVCWRELKITLHQSKNIKATTIKITKLIIIFIFITIRVLRPREFLQVKLSEDKDSLSVSCYNHVFIGYLMELLSLIFVSVLTWRHVTLDPKLLPIRIQRRVLIVRIVVVVWSSLWVWINHF